MKISAWFLLLPLLILGNLSLGAQSYDLGPADELPPPAEVEVKDFSLYEDPAPGVFYIDFESISSKIEEIAVVDQVGEPVWTANVFSLPGNSIYELDLQGLSPGRYEIELRAFNRVLRHQIHL